MDFVVIADASHPVRGNILRQGIIQKHQEAFRSTWKYSEAQGNIQKHKETFRSTRKHSEAPGSIQKHQEVFRSTRQYTEPPGSIQKPQAVFRSTRNHSESPKRSTKKHSEARNSAVLGSISKNIVFKGKQDTKTSQLATLKLSENLQTFEMGDSCNV
jgi:hypothetical protein